MSNRQDWAKLRSEAVEDLVYWLHEITVLPEHRKDWAKGKVRLCKLCIREAKLNGT